MAYVSPYRDAHESFPQPDDAQIKVWRYLDLPRLIALLAKRELSFARVDLFSDVFEGALPRPAFEMWKTEIDALNVAYSAKWERPLDAADMARTRAEQRHELYASCWHANDSESEAMWRLYCGLHEGVALQTSYEELDRSLPPDVFLGMVTYIDFEKTDYGRAVGNGLTPIMHKRAAFRHEHEVRAVLWRPELFGPLPVEYYPRVLSVAWKPEETVQNVFVSPYADGWYRDVVAEVLKCFGPDLLPRLQWSRMKAEPFY